jgi:hypothetical protein
MGSWLGSCAFNMPERFIIRLRYEPESYGGTGVMNSEGFREQAVATGGTPFSPMTMTASISWQLWPRN